MSVRSLASERRDYGRRLRGLARAVGTRSIDAMYADPFWSARFGERGRTFANDDGRRHVQYLAEAVETGQPEPLATYVRWLQGVLTTRGMCSLHIHDTLLRLEDAVGAEDPELQAAASPFVMVATDALRPPDPAIARVYGEAVTQLRPAAVHPCVEHPSFLLSYLCDALQFGRDENLLQHVDWLRQYAAPLGRPVVETLVRTLDAVSATVARQPASDPISHATRLMRRIREGQDAWA